MKKTVAIIGAGTETGTSVSKELVTGPWHLLLLDEDPGLLEFLLKELTGIVPDTDAEVLLCMVDACWEADIIILAIPVNKKNDIPAKLREVATGKTVVIMAHSNDELTLEELKMQLPYSKITSLQASSINELFIHLNNI